MDLSDDAETGSWRPSVRGDAADVAIGTGLPEVLFLDEPPNGLDPEARRRAWTAVENLTATGTTVVLTTHYIDARGDHRTAA